MLISLQHSKPLGYANLGSESGEWNTHDTTKSSVFVDKGFPDALLPLKQPIRGDFAMQSLQSLHVSWYHGNCQLCIWIMEQLARLSDCDKNMEGMDVIDRSNKLIFISDIY